MNVKRVTIIIVAVAIAISFASKILQHYADKKVAAQTSPQRLQQLAAEVNQSLPHTINENFRLEKVTAHAAEFEYIYTVFGYTAADIDMNEFAQVMKNQVIGIYCSNPQLQPLRTNNILMSASYYDNGGNLMTKVSADNTACNPS